MYDSAQEFMRLKLALLFGIFFTSISWSQNLPFLGVWVAGTEKTPYQIKQSHLNNENDKPSARLIRYDRNTVVGTELGVNYYGVAKTQVRDGVPEHDLLTGEYFGPALLSSKWNSRDKILSAQFSNGRFLKFLGKLKAPQPIQNNITDALIDSSLNVFWIMSKLDGSLRIFHQHLVEKNIPVTEIAFGQNILKIRSTPLADGLLVLLSEGTLLKVTLQNNELKVTRINIINEYLIFDFEMGPIGDEVYSFSLVTHGINSKTGKVDLFLHKQNALKEKQMIEPIYWNEIQYAFPLKAPFLLMGNTHFTPLETLVKTSPAELNPFLQAQFLMNRSTISDLMNPSLLSNSGSLLDLSKIKRTLLSVEAFPSVCRYFLHSLKENSLSAIYLN